MKSVMHLSVADMWTYTLILSIAAGKDQWAAILQSLKLCLVFEPIVRRNDTRWHHVCSCVGIKTELTCVLGIIYFILNKISKKSLLYKQKKITNHRFEH